MKKRCIKCGKLKETDEFYANKSTIDGLNKWCKDCSRKYRKNWYKHNKERHKKNCIRYKRQHRIVTKGGRILKGKKRKRPKDGICELCGRECDKEKKQLSYHHWDDNNLLKGIWVCYKCHGFVEGFMPELGEKWLSLKEKIDKEAERKPQRKMGDYK